MRWLLGWGRIAEILDDLGAQRTGIDDGSLNGAKQAVGKGCEGLCEGGVWLRFGAPGAEQRPEDDDRQPSNARGAEGGQDRKCGDKANRDENEAGAKPEAVSQNDSSGKEPRGVEQRDGIWLRSGRRGECRTGA